MITTIFAKQLGICSTTAFIKFPTLEVSNQWKRYGQITHNDHKKNMIYFGLVHFHSTKKVSLMFVVDSFIWCIPTSTFLLECPRKLVNG